VIEIFRLPSRAQFVIAGTITVGEVRPGMNVLVLLDSKLYWRIPIAAVEFVDRIAGRRESLVGLVCAENTTEDAELCHGLCEMGTELEIAEASAPKVRDPAGKGV
jgi:hypothetical protein